MKRIGAINADEEKGKSERKRVRRQRSKKKYVGRERGETENKKCVCVRM